MASILVVPASIKTHLRAFACAVCAGGDNFVTQTADSDSDSDNDNETNNKTNNDNDNDPAICVYKVRKHLCIRIIGTVNDNNNDQVTYKVWTFDVARGEEWTTTSPKSFLDFQKLRVALGKLRPSIGQIQFPKVSELNFIPSSRSEAS